MTTTVKMFLGSFAACFALGAVAEAPAVSGVMVRQRWPWSRLVDIDYVLTCDSGAKVDVAVEAYDGAAPLALPLNSLSGDLYGVDRGSRRIVWDPTVTAYTNSGALPQFRVALTPTNAPLYMIVDLKKAVGADGQIEYVYEADLTNGLWGSWVRNPVTNNGEVIESVVWTGVATNDLYKTNKLVLRRVWKGTFGMGENASLPTTLTKGFYAGVFEVTQGQWLNVTYNPGFNHTSGDGMLPAEMVSYESLRGATNSVPPINWPSTGDAVSSGSFLGKLRSKTGISGFDLPTEAQREYAGRAGTTGSNNVPGVALGNLGWYGGNAGGATHPVGEKIPNAWGFYDMHGNVWEWCLDWFESAKVNRTARGGAYGSGEGNFVSWSRWYEPPAHGRTDYGFRLVVNFP